MIASECDKYLHVVHISAGECKRRYNYTIISCGA